MTDHMALKKRLRDLEEGFKKKKKRIEKRQLRKEILRIRRQIRNNH